MDDIRFQHELQEIKRRVNEMTLRQMARSPRLGPVPMVSSHDSFKAQLGDIRAHVDSLAASLTTQHTITPREDRFATFERRLHALEQSHYALEIHVDGLQPVLTPATSVTSSDGGVVGPTVELDASPGFPFANLPSSEPSSNSEVAQIARLRDDLRREQIDASELRRNIDYLAQRNCALETKTIELQADLSRLSQPASTAREESHRDVELVKSDAFRQLVNRQRELIRQERAELAHVTADRRLRQDEIESLRAQLEHAQAAVRSKSTWIEDLYEKNKAYVAALEGERELMRDMTRARDLLMETLVSRDRTISDLEQKLDAAQQDHNRMLHQADVRRSSDVDRLQDFCEQKDTIIQQQAEVISRGGRLLQEKDDEIDTITKRLEEEKAKCMEQQDKLVAALMKKDHEISRLVASPKQHETRILDPPETLPNPTQNPTSKNEDQLKPAEKISPTWRDGTSEKDLLHGMTSHKRPQSNQGAPFWNQDAPEVARLWFGEPSTTLPGDTEDQDSDIARANNNFRANSSIFSKKLPHEGARSEDAGSPELRQLALQQPPLGLTTKFDDNYSTNPSEGAKSSIRKLPYQPREADVQWYKTMKVLKPQKLPLEYTKAPPLPMAPQKMASEANLRARHSGRENQARHRSIPRHQSLNDFAKAMRRDHRRLQAYAESEEEDGEQHRW